MNRKQADRLAVLTSASMHFIECAGTVARIVRREVEHDSADTEKELVQAITESISALIDIASLYGRSLSELVENDVSTEPPPRIEQWDGQRKYPGLIESPVLEPTEDNPSGVYGQIKTEEGIDSFRSAWETCIKGDWLVFDQHGMVRDVIPAKRVQE